MGEIIMYGDYDSDENKWSDKLILERSELDRLREKIQHVYSVLNKAAEEGNLMRCRQACENMSIYIGGHE